MLPLHDTPAQKPTPAERIRAGEEAAGFLESPLFGAIQRVARAFQDSRTQALMGIKPTNEGASYAALVGEAKGIARLTSLIEGLVTDGKAAEAELRKAEEEGSS